MYGIIFGISIMLLIAGLIVFAIGVRKAIRSKYRDLDCILWCFAGNAILISASTIMAKLL